ncbi:hypothetical protein HJC23_001088 [Cyclotella cryptica]|uniref:N-acetylglucosaminylphosphatidylinositol deacetylase n=1 Tax=Cyclotella cryptica TaxID=29204 RepID=A0ABD3QJB4_9STRA|eukprot:CCRYP_005049-RA/>CCRYP_005049-RA protein AED:0.10 eAED:-0.13 QI:0/-1/0/1/-1/1/1/0/548
MAGSDEPTDVQRDLWILVTAHPDDESMFFLPTLRNLLLPNGNNQCLHILCLCNGAYERSSDGPIRTKELYDACKIIGINSPSVTVINEDSLKDGPNEVWDGSLVAAKIMDCIKEAVLSCTNRDDKRTRWKYVDNTIPPSAKQKAQSINLNILTFDLGGVSHHPNHVDTFKGVRYLLHEKAYSTRVSNVDSNAIHSHMTLSNDTENIQIKIRVTTLKTISNPLYKYFFWAFYELLPYLVLLSLQLIWQLILFLVGRRIWSRNPTRDESIMVPHFSGQTNISETTTRYRMMEPTLAWRAMSAHQSQFVWYRRLSVMFSRYTFINDLVELLPDESCLFPKEEEDQNLPSVVAIQEEESDPKFLLATEQMNALRDSILPPSLQLRPWKRVYSLSRDGDSFIAFQRLVCGWNSKNGQHSTLLVVRTTHGEVIGGYADIPFVETVKHPSGGGAGSCLFKMEQGMSENEPKISVYGKSNGACKRIVLDATRRIIAFGGGAGEGGEDNGFGLCLEDGFLRGTTARCEAFGNEKLVNGGDVFEVTDMEVWGFVFGQL